MADQKIIPEEYRNNPPYRVDAGKFEDDGSRNYKYCDAFESLEEGLAAVKSCQGYHFVEFHYVDPNGKVWDMSSVTPVTQD